MPAVVQHLARPGRLASTSPRPARCGRARHADARRPRQLRRPGQDRRRARPGGRRRRHDRDGVRDRGRARRRDRRARSASARASRSASTPTSRSRARACGWAAARSSSASTPSRCPALLARARARRRRRSSASTSSPARRTSTPRSSARRSARPSSSRCGWPTTRRRRSRYLNLGGGFGIPYFDRRTSRSTSAAVGDNLARLLDDAIRAAAARGARRRSSSAATSSASAGVYVTRVVDRKVSRGKTFLVVDGGLHHQLAASGNFGQVIRRNYPVAVGNRDRASADARRVSVVGCLCTPLDLLADDVDAAARRRRRPGRRLPGRRLRPDRQPHRLPRPPGAGRGARLTTVQPRGTHGTQHRHQLSKTSRPSSSRRWASRTAPTTLDASTPLLGALPELDSIAVARARASRSRTRFDITVDGDDVTAEVFETLAALTAFVDGKLA